MFFIYVVACNRPLSIFNSIPFWDIPYSVYLSAGGYLGCFQFWAIRNKMLQTFVYKYLCGYMFHTFRVPVESSILWLYPGVFSQTPLGAIYLVSDFFDG